MRLSKKWPQNKIQIQKYMQVSCVGICTALLMLITLPGNAYAQEILRVAAVAKAPIIAKAVNILKNVYQHAGVKVAFEFLPAGRSIKVANAGIFDGEALRTVKAAAQYPNLLQVKVPLVEDGLVAWAAKDIGPILSRGDFSSLRVGVKLGDVAIQKYAKGAEIFSTPNTLQAAKMLVRDRIDIVLAWKRNFLPIIASTPEFRKIHAVSKDLYVAKGYHFLHKKHKDLVPRIEDSLRELWADGSMDKMWRTSN